MAAGLFEVRGSGLERRCLLTLQPQAARAGARTLPQGMFVPKVLAPGFRPLQLLPRLGQGRGLLQIHASPDGQEHGPSAWVRWCRQHKGGVPTAMGYPQCQ